MSRLRDYAWLEWRTGIRRPTLRSYVHRRILPVVRIGPRLVRFDEDAIEKWIADRAEAGQ